MDLKYLDDLKLDRKIPLVRQIYPAIKSMIIEGKILPGELIDEKAIAAYLTVSRTPVREAVKKLHEGGLVSVVAQSATRAAQLDLALIEESHIIRRALEVASAREAAKRITTEHVEALEDLMAEHLKLLDQERYVEAIYADDKFHNYIAEISHMSTLWKMIAESKAQIDRCRHIVLPKLGEGETTIEHHNRIILALATGDPDKAADAMKAHLDVAFGSIKAMVQATGLDFPSQPKPGGRGKRIG